MADIRREGTHRHQSFRYYITIAVLLIAVLFIGLFSFLSYTEAREDLLEKDRALREQTQQHLSQSVALIDQGLKLFDATFDYQLEVLFADFLAEYERCGRDPGRMDLAALKEEINRKSTIEGEIELSIINETGIIEYNTFAPDIGLDFKQWPEAWELVNEIRLGDQFAADRSVGGAANVLRKFAYMPTPDHRYVLEFGLASDAFHEKRREFSYSKVAADYEKNSEDILSVRFFDSDWEYLYGSSFSMFDGNAPDYIPESSVKETVSQVYQGQDPLEVIDEENATLTHYFFIDLYSKEYVSGPEMSMVAQVVYSTAGLKAGLANLMTTHLLIALLAIFTGIIFAFFTSYFISRPVNEIVADIEQIAGGDLDHQVRGGSGTEFTRLRQSINTMAVTLKGNINQIRKSEEKIKCYSENLEEMVNNRTTNLQLANEQLNMYLEIITRDISHATMVTRSYLSLLIKELSGEKVRIAERALEGVRDNARILRNVDILRRMYEENLQRKPMDLHRVIEEVAAEAAERHPDIQIHYPGTDAQVFADELLRDVFCNLISNSRKYGGPGVEIWISVDDRDNEVEVTFADNGPGIPDSMKNSLFIELNLTRTWANGKGLGLHVVQSIVEWYGGHIRVADRVKERPEDGVAIIFTLKRHKEH